MSFLEVGQCRAPEMSCCELFLAVPILGAGRRAGRSEEESTKRAGFGVTGCIRPILGICVSIGSKARSCPPKGDGGLDERV